MKLILKIKPNKPSKKKRIIAWIKKHPDFNDDVRQFFKIFQDDIKISKISKILNYNVVTSENPAIILSLFTSIQESIPEVYFNKENSINLDDFIDKDNILK
ncbi:MAG: hypothetical protein ACFFB0_19490 [Promethearchaeota archaeon]